MNSPTQSPRGNSKIIGNRKMNYNADMVMTDDKDDQGKGEAFPVEGKQGCPG